MKLREVEKVMLVPDSLVEYVQRSQSAASIKVPECCILSIYKYLCTLHGNLHYIYSVQNRSLQLTVRVHYIRAYTHTAFGRSLYCYCNMWCNIYLGEGHWQANTSRHWHVQNAANDFGTIELFNWQALLNSLCSMWGGEWNADSEWRLKSLSMADLTNRKMCVEFFAKRCGNLQNAVDFA